MRRTDLIGRADSGLGRISEFAVAPVSRGSQHSPRLMRLIVARFCWSAERPKRTPDAPIRRPFSSRYWPKMSTEPGSVPGIGELHLNESLGVYVLHAWIWKHNESGVLNDTNARVGECPL